MRFDRLSKAQGAYILGEAIGHERTAAVGECPVRRAVRHGFSPIQLGPHCPPELRKCKRYSGPADSFCFWKLDRDQLSTEVRQFCLALCNG